MALELTAGISATATVLTVTGTLPTDLAYGYEFRIGDELLTFERYEPDRTLMAGQSAEVPFAPIPSLFVWQVRRGQGGSTAASHLAAASLVGVNEANVSGVTTAKPIPWPSGSGGGAVDSVNGQTGVVVLDAGDLATAAPIVEPDVQAALEAVEALGLAGTLNVSSAVPDGFTITGPDGSQFTLGSDGSWEINGATSLARFSLGADGAVALYGKNPATPGSEGAQVHLNADGSMEVRASTGPTLSFEEGQILISSLPETDPAVNHALWSSEGVLMVSAG